MKIVDDLNEVYSSEFLHFKLVVKMLKTFFF